MAAKGWQDAKGGRRGVGEARGNRGRGGRVGWWRKKRRWRRRKEESRVNRGQVALPDATRSPTHPPTLHPSHPDDPANPLSSSSASSSSSSSSFSTSYPNLCPLLLPLPPSYPRWSPIRPTFHAHTPRCVPILLLLHASVHCSRLIARFHPSLTSSSFSAVVSADLFRADRSNKSLSY